jgi:hypothetical protein
MKPRCTRSRNLRTTGGVGLLLLLAFLFAPRTVAQVPDPKAQVGSPTSAGFEAPSSADVDRAITLAASYLERTCGTDGRSAYSVNVNSDQQSDSYNIVRHAGAIYALAMLQRSNPDQHTLDTMVRAASFLRQNYIGPGVRPDQKSALTATISTTPVSHFAGSVHVR